MSDGSRVQGAMIQDRGSWGLRGLGFRLRANTVSHVAQVVYALLRVAGSIDVLAEKNHASCV